MLTKIILIAVIVGLIVYDIFARDLSGVTESMVLRDWARDWTLLPFCAGFLLGHWFAPQAKVNWSAWMYALPIFAGLLIVDIVFNLKGYNPETTTLPMWRYSLWYALAGIPLGAVLWAQPAPWSPL